MFNAAPDCGCSPSLESAAARGRRRREEWGGGRGMKISGDA